MNPRAMERQAAWDDAIGGLDFGSGRVVVANAAVDDADVEGAAPLL